jgi:pyruvate,orthophosphate dikinase
MSRLGLPVPPGFTITTAVAAQYLSRGSLGKEVKDEVLAALVGIEAMVGRTFALSVRASTVDFVPGVSGTVLSADRGEQLWSAIGAVFSSWNSERARSYRKLRGLAESPLVACTVQAILSDSEARVACTRDPRTGENALFGKWLPEGRVLEELVRTGKILERHFADAMDIEFTVERGELLLLGCEPARRSAGAAVRMAVEMAREGLLTKAQAVLRVEPTSVDALLHRTIDEDAPKRLIAKGLPASPGAASGVVVLSAPEAIRRGEAGASVIFVRTETSPDDVHGMRAAAGILTARGGMTSHAALAARGMGRCCIVGCSAIEIADGGRSFTTDDGTVVGEGDSITLDGVTGCVYMGVVPTRDAELGGDMVELLGWADELRTLGVRANADTPRDARTAHGFGAEGIGLCRTERMFFEDDRLPWMVEMIMAKDKPARESALAKLLPFQREDFVGLFCEMKGLPVTIRLLDPPLHEFVPHGGAEVEALAAHLGRTPEEVARRAAELDEHNPMLGHRGCRLAITYPEIYEMQVRAILQAAIEARRRGIEVIPEIMIPLVAVRAELSRMRELVRAVAEDVFASEGTSIEYRFGTMIELPRAALIADELAQGADFFSFGTNDLTQTALGLSRDDASRFLVAYVDQDVLPADPFQSVDVAGVGLLVKMATEKGRAANPAILMGVCGEHGGDPKSIAYFAAIGLDYVSCSPFRVPVARLAAAQAALP